MTAPAPSIPTTSIDPGTQVGLLSVTVADLARSLSFYTEVLGFAPLKQDEKSAILGAGDTPLLLIREETGAQPWPRDQRSYTGLYHFAILLPTRGDLGRWLRHWLESGMGLPGQGDHLVSEALYLEDPDGNGIEIYRDRPRNEWQRVNGQIRMGSDPVDLRGVLTEADREGKPWTGFPTGTRLGHMHLQVGDIADASAFYHGALGFDVVASMPSALFVSAGGYHHHIGMNTWHSLGSGPAPAGVAGLQFFTIDLPSEETREAVLSRLDAAGIPHTRAGQIEVIRDPWQNTILLQVGTAADAATAEALATAATARE
jgi:catechol 2,3-dioxygenase